MRVERKLSDFVLLGVSSAIIFAFYRYVWKLIFPFPCGDTFDAVFGFADRFFLAPSLYEKIVLVFSQHNEHRMVFSRLLTIASVGLTGKIHLAQLATIGNASLIGLLTLFILSLLRIKEKLFPLLVTTSILLLFQPQCWEALIQIEASLSCFVVLLFVFLSLYLLAKNSNKSLFFAMFSAIAATFTNSNGIFVFFIGAGVLFYQKRWKDLGVWVTVSIACIAFYFFGYKKPPYHPSILASLTHPFHTVAYYFCFLGASPLSLIFKEGKLNGCVAFLVGAVFFLFYLYLVKKKYFKKNIVLFSFVSYLFFTGSAVALGRSGFGIMQALSSRYTIYSNLLLVSFFLITVDVLPEKIAKYFSAGFLIFSIIFNFCSYRDNYNNIMMRKNAIVASLIEWTNTKTGLLHPDPKQANSILDTSMANGYFSPPDVPEDFLLPNKPQLQWALPVSKTKVTYNIDKFEENGEAVVAEGWAYIKKLDSKKAIIFLLLRSEKAKYMIRTVSQKRPDVTSYFNKRNYDDSGFAADFSKRYLRKGLYQVGLCVKKGDVEAVVYTDKDLHIE